MRQKRRGGSTPEIPDDGGSTAQAPVIGTFTIAADTGETYGKLNQTHKLAWTITGDCTAKTVTVKKGEAAAASTDYEYTEQTQKIIFKTTGSYTVTLKASNGDKSMSKNVTIAITDFTDPVVTLPVDKSETVDVAIDFVPGITYDADDAKGTETIAVTYTAAGGTAQTVTDDSAYYTLSDGKFTAKQVGEYKVTVSVTSLKGKTASQVWTLTALNVGAVAANIVEDPDWQKEDGKILVEKSAATDFVYQVTGYNADRFDVTVSLKKGSDDKNAMVAHTAADKKLTVTATETGDYTLSITFTNKTDTANTSTATWNLRVKDDITAPVFGADPFGGTHTTLMPNVGMQLYFDATDDKVQTLDYGTHITYRIVETGTTATGATIVNDGAFVKHPYVIATAAGKIIVEISATDGVNTPVKATKEFTVTAYDNYTQYFKTVYAGTNVFYNSATTWVDGFFPNDRDTVPVKCVATKNGIIEASSLAARTVGSYIGIDTPYTNYTITFDYTILGFGTAPNDYGDIYFYARNASDVDVGGVGITFNTGDKVCNSFTSSNQGNNVVNDLVPSHTQVTAPAVGQTFKLRIVKQAKAIKFQLSLNGTDFQDVVTGNFNDAGAGQMKNVFLWTRGFINFEIANITVAEN